MSFYDFEFSAPLSRHSMGMNARGALFYTVMYVPEDVLNRMGAAYRPRLRVEGEIANLPFNAALMPSQGQVYIKVPKVLLKQMEVGGEDLLEVRFQIADQDSVDIPPPLQEALDQHAWAAEPWAKLTAGKQRGFCYRVATAKTQKTIEKRLAEVLDSLKEIPS